MGCCNKHMQTIELRKQKWTGQGKLMLLNNTVIKHIGHCTRVLQQRGITVLPTSPQNFSILALIAPSPWRRRRGRRTLRRGRRAPPLRLPPRTSCWPNRCCEGAQLEGSGGGRAWAPPLGAPWGGRLRGGKIRSPVPPAGEVSACGRGRGGLGGTTLCPTIIC